MDGSMLSRLSTQKWLEEDVSHHRAEVRRSVRLRIILKSSTRVKRRRPRYEGTIDMLDIEVATRELLDALVIYHIGSKTRANLSQELTLANVPFKTYGLKIDMALALARYEVDTLLSPQLLYKPHQRIMAPYYFAVRADGVVCPSICPAQF